MLESWRWLHSLHSTVENREVDYHVIDAVIAAMPQFAGIKDAAPDATLPHSWAEAGARTASLQRSYRNARQYQRARTTSAAAGCKDTMFAFSMEVNNDRPAI